MVLGVPILKHFRVKTEHELLNALAFFKVKACKTLKLYIIRSSIFTVICCK